MDESVRYFTCDEFRVLLSKVEECSDEIERLRAALEVIIEIAPDEGTARFASNALRDYKTELTDE